MITSIISILMLCLECIGGQPGGEAQLEDIQGVFKLAKYVSWPNEDQMTTTTIMILPQSDESYKTAESLASGSRILNSVISLKRIETCDDDIDNANIIFIESGTGIDIDKVLQKTANKQILTITNDLEILEKGCMFYVKHEQGTEQILYFYNKDAILASPLSISSHILTPDHKYEKK
ncbi:MAG: YfiR family protein [Bacteroidales bacterium]|nr:YfiR family protein [Bacteroidales bacterium]